MAARQPGSGETKEYPFYVNPEWSSGTIGTHVTRGKVSESPWSLLRYVLNPIEKWPSTRAPAAQRAMGPDGPGWKYPQPDPSIGQRSVSLNRERELGLDRRETG